MHEPWFQRTFSFDIPVARFPVIIERLRGTPIRASAKVAGLPPDILTHRRGHTWSIQENLGHLADLEVLWLARLDDFLTGTPSLRVADLDNKATWNANHNARPIADVLDTFRASRARFVDRLERWDPATLDRTALHPRMQVPMRVIDHAHFVAEHDDYHLTRIHELLTTTP